MKNRIKKNHIEYFLMQKLKADNLIKWMENLINKEIFCNCFNRLSWYERLRLKNFIGYLLRQGGKYKDSFEEKVRRENMSHVARSNVIYDLG